MTIPVTPAWGPHPNDVQPDPPLHEIPNTIIDDTISGNSDNSNTMDSADLEALIQTPLQLGQTLIIITPMHNIPLRLLTLLLYHLHGNHTLPSCLKSLGCHLDPVMILNKQNSLSNTTVPTH